MSIVPASIPKDHPLANSWRGWSLERVLFALGGTMVGISALLSALVSPWFLLLTGFVSLNLLLFAAVGSCGASIVLRLFGIRSRYGR